MAAAAAASSSSSAGNKKIRSRAAKKGVRYVYPSSVTNEEIINWKTHKFIVGEKFSLIAVPEYVWNEIEVSEIELSPSGKQKQIKVRYFGWHFEFDSTFDEWLTLNDELYDRMDKKGTGVHRVKCFVNLGPGLLNHWPCMALIREPINKDAENELRGYNTVYVEVGR